MTLFIVTIPSLVGRGLKDKDKESTIGLINLKKERRQINELRTSL